MSPEYAMHGQFSIKSDVYSFGVLILEIVSGQRNSASYESGNDDDLLSQVRPCSFGLKFTKLNYTELLKEQK